MRTQVYLYRGYGFLVLEKFDKARRDLEAASKMKRLDVASIYNKYLALGLLRLENNDHEGALPFFEKASLKFEKNKEPYVLQVVALVNSCLANSEATNVDDPRKQKRMLQAKAVLD